MNNIYGTRYIAGRRFARASFANSSIIGLTIALACFSNGVRAQAVRDISGFALVPAPVGWSPEHVQLGGFVPDDPYYATGNPVGFPGQWHLNKQSSSAVVDTNVVPAWNRNLTGQGVIIGIVDDGLQIDHPDLSPNYVAADSFDFGQNDGDPSPVYVNTLVDTFEGDNHGTSVAGVAAARGGNLTGGTGAAPNAGLAGLRLDFVNQSDAMAVNATLYHSSGANTNIKIKNHSYGHIVPYITTNNQVNALVTSANAGTIHVFAAHNQRLLHEGSYVIDTNNNGVFDPDIDPAYDADANKKPMQSVSEAITVAALASSGIFANYSNWGANVFVTAPSSSFRTGEYAITTTDRTGGAIATGGYNNSLGNADFDDFPDLDYNSIFGGTSSATPLVAGILALAKQAQPVLNTRMAKHLLARTSDIVDPSDTSLTGGWVTNGAGFKFNENYGFGNINADRLTTEAVNYSGVTPLVIETVSTTTVSQAIPDNNAAGISRTFNLVGLGTKLLEDIEVRLNIAHTWRGQLEAYLTSPMGTTSRLMYQNPADSFNNFNWSFLSNAFWGENPTGQWTLNVRDVIGANAFGNFTGTWISFNVRAKTGTLIPEPSSVSLALVAFGIVSSRRRRSGNQSSQQLINA
jgi:subtilisin-like proprotein convertase family protein